LSNTPVLIKTAISGGSEKPKEFFTTEMAIILPYIELIYNLLTNNQYPRL
jgi:hypothetical protein